MTVKTETKWEARAALHMKKTRHPAIGTLDGWTCLTCPAAGGSCIVIRTRTQQDDDTGNYYDNFVDGNGF